jgi:hypothetical protein
MTTVTLERRAPGEVLGDGPAHIVWDDRPDLALCGVDVTVERRVGDEWPPCRACLNVERDLWVVARCG